ncbi:MAG TPA: DUF4340 domain-containing protein [Gammaproteobacteria bacterium]
MTTRTLVGLVAALAVLTLLALYGQRSETPSSRNDALLLPELESALADIDRVTVVGAGGEAVATMRRTPEHWLIAEKDDYPADVGKIREALLGLARARIVEEKTSNPEYYERLGVRDVDTEDARGVAITAFSGDRAFPSVIVGDAAGGGYRYVRLADEPESYLVDQELDVPNSGAEWVDPTIVDIPGTRISRVTIEHPDGETVTIVKESEDQTNFTVENVPEGRELTYAGVANVIGNSLRDLRLDDVEAATEEAGDVSPVVTTFHTFDGLVVTARGFEGDDGAWVTFEASVDPDAQAAVEETSDEETSDADEASGGAAAAEPETEAADAAPAGEDAAGTADEEKAAESAQAEDADDGGEAVDPAEEAERINARVRGWRYKIPSYQFDQMTRRMADLLKAPETE